MIGAGDVKAWVLPVALSAYFLRLQNFAPPTNTSKSSYVHWKFILLLFLLELLKSAALTSTTTIYSAPAPLHQTREYHLSQQVDSDLKTAPAREIINILGTPHPRYLKVYLWQV